MKSKTFSEPFDKLLPHCELNTRIARLVVLYEDLQLEACGIASPELLDLDIRGLEYRHLYFIRRIVATLNEFTSAVIHLNQSEEFAKVRVSLKPEELRKWKEAVTFFETNKETFKNIRDDVGAHFQRKISDYSTSNINSGSVATIEVVKGTNGRLAIKFSFADEVVVTALTARRGDKTPEEFINHLVKLTREGCRYATIPARLVFDYFMAAMHT